MKYLLPLLLLFVYGTAKADDFNDRIAALEAKAATRASPSVKTVDPFSSKNAKACACHSPDDCTCGTTCSCASCANKTSGPKVGDQKVTDDPSRPWTYGDGHEYGYDEMGWYRPAKVAPVAVPMTYYQPQQSFSGGGRVCST